MKHIMKYNIGDIIYISSPNYKVTSCRGVVVRLSEYDASVRAIKILDDTEFDHYNFENHRQHNLEEGDVILKKEQPNLLPEDLFTL